MLKKGKCWRWKHPRILSFMIPGRTICDVSFLLEGKLFALAFIIKFYSLLSEKLILDIFKFEALKLPRNTFRFPGLFSCTAYRVYYIMWRLNGWLQWQFGGIKKGIQKGRSVPIQNDMNFVYSEQLEIVLGSVYGRYWVDKAVKKKCKCYILGYPR